MKVLFPILSADLKEAMDLFCLQICVPTLSCQLNAEDVSVKIWKMKWSNHIHKYEIAKDGLTALQQYDVMYPILSQLLNILCTLPTSIASSEISFSGLDSKLVQDPECAKKGLLTGLVLMNVHKNILLNEDNIIQRFSKNRVKRNIILIIIYILLIFIVI